MASSHPSGRPLEVLTTTEGRAAGLPTAGEDAWRLDVNVLYTTRSGTLAALKSATRLTASLGTRPRVHVLYVVPWTLPLERRALPPGFLAELVSSLGQQSSTAISVQVYLCREAGRCVREIFQPHSLIVVGGRKRWWRTSEQRLAEILERAGHLVIFANLE